MFPGCHHPGALLTRDHERRERSHEVVLQRQVQCPPLLHIRVPGVLVNQPQDLFDCFEGIQSLHEFLRLTPANNGLMDKSRYMLFSFFTWLDSRVPEDMSFQMDGQGNKWFQKLHTFLTLPFRSV